MAWHDVIPKIKLPTGTVGKICMMLIAVALAIAAISVSAHDKWIALAALILLTGIVLVLGNKIIDFADKHPDAALLEGKHFLDYAQIDKTKYTPSRVIDPSDKSDKMSAALPAPDSQALPQPHEEQDG
jgi:hypothetical protein